MVLEELDDGPIVFPLQPSGLVGLIDRNNAIGLCRSQALRSPHGQLLGRIQNLRSTNGGNYFIEIGQIRVGLDVLQESGLVSHASLRHIVVLVPGVRACRPKQGCPGQHYSGCYLEKSVCLHNFRLSIINYQLSIH